MAMAGTPPPQSEGEMMQQGLHQLIQHNNNTPYPSLPQDQYDERARLQHSNYGSPAPDDQYAYRGQQQRYPYQHQHQDSGLGVQYDYAGSMYADQYSTPATSPPTPSMNHNDLLRTRSGLGLQRNHQNLRPMPDNRSRIGKSSPKPKREPKRTKVKAESKVAKLEKPLSELTKDWTHVAVVDIDAYVNRSAEVRRREVEEGKIPGKVKRPMNSFMLYRKAYQNRTKDWCLQNNHQVVSQVCGDSWPLEPDVVKDQFSEWARIERLNHQNAHPGYKFSPTKPGQGKGGNKRKVSEEPTSEASDLDDFEWQGSSSRKKTKHHRPAPRQDRRETPVMYPSTRNAYSYSRENSVEDYQGGYNRSLFQHNNPGVPLPPPYNQAGLRQGEYYQQTIQTNPRIPGAEDVIIRKTDTPGSFLGLPGGQEFNMMNHQNHQNQQYSQYGHQQPQGQRMDPAMMGQGQQQYENPMYPDQMAENFGFPDGQHGEQPWQPSYGIGHDPVMPFIDPQLTQDGGQIQDPHMHALKGNQEGWQVESLDNGGEFDKWMDEEQ